MEKKINALGVMVDCSRDAVYTVETLKRYIDLLAKMGYTSLQLYTEDTYTIDEPYFGYLRGRYSEKELQTVDGYAKEKGIELIPCVQTLAHLSGFLRWKGELVDYADIMLAGSEEVYAVIDKMFAACAKCFTSRRINIGMDEANMVGLGRYLDEHGYENRSDILLKHIKRVLEIAEKYGFTAMMWSDMFFRLANNGGYIDGNKEIPEEVLKVTPSNVELVYWDYWTMDQEVYDRMIRSHQRFKNKIIFAGGATSWTGFVPKNGASIDVTEQAIKACLNNGIEEFIQTCWKDDGAECSLFASLPTLYATACMARGEFDREKWKQGFAQEFGVDFEGFMALDAPDRLDKDVLWGNPCKYMLYSDPFLGIFDATVDVNKKGVYATAEKDLQTKAANMGDYKYIFQTLSALCGVMKFKYTLGVETRAAYRDKDKKALAVLSGAYGELEEHIEWLYQAFRTQWMRESKPYGFEKQDIRFGGLSRRIRHCKERLEAYCRGEISRIEELEEEILPYPNSKKGKTVCVNQWLITAMIKPNM